MFKKTLSHPIYRKQESFIITDIIIFYLPLVLKFQNTFIFLKYVQNCISITYKYRKINFILLVKPSRESFGRKDLEDQR